MGTELPPNWSFWSGLSTVAHNVAKLYGLRSVLGDSGPGVGNPLATILKVMVREEKRRLQSLGQTAFLVVGNVVLAQGVGGATFR